MKKLIFILLLLLSCIPAQQQLFDSMHKEAGISSFEKIGWVHYRNYKCNPNDYIKQEYLALDVNGNPIIIITCCSFIFNICNAVVVK